MDKGKRASCHFSMAQISDHLTQRAEWWFDEVHLFVYLLMNIVTYLSSQDDKAPPSFWISMPSWICCGHTGHTGETSRVNHVKL